MPFFERVPLASPDPILGLTAAYLADARENKVNLGVGYYRDEMLRTPIMHCVKLAEQVLLESEPSKEYLPIDGHRAFLEKVGELVFGSAFWGKQHVRISGFQTIGGTGALKIGGTFCKEEVDGPIFIPAPTWPNHRGVFTGCHLRVDSYHYYDFKTRTIAFDSWVSFLETLSEGSVLLLHASCHNPTGCDPTFEEWKRLAEVMRRKKLIPFFDFAYQGLGKGVAEDANAVRYFAENGFEMFVAFSSAKNFSLYGERVGALFILTENSKTAEHITSRVKQMIRTNYSNPPKHGAAIVSHILCTPSLKEQWIDELNQMRTRIIHMRKELSQRLIKQSKTIDFRHLKSGFGMFCYLGLEGAQVERLVQEYGIHMPRDGRVNMCGLNQNNIDYVVDSILKVVS
jgi:aspartate/tyrosine/aromatic aminotransferase